MLCFKDLEIGEQSWTKPGCATIASRAERRRRSGVTACHPLQYVSDSGNVTECLRALADRHHATLHQLEVDNAHVTNEGVGVLPLLTCELVWLCVF